MLNNIKRAPHTALGVTSQAVVTPQADKSADTGKAAVAAGVTVTPAEKRRQAPAKSPVVDGRKRLITKGKPGVNRKPRKRLITKA